MDNPPEAFFAILPVLIIGLIILLVLGVAAAQQSRRFEALRVIAARWQGTAISGGMLGHPHAELRIGGALARLQFSTQHKRTITELTIHFPDPSIRMEIYPQTIVDEMRKFLGMQDIEIGVRSFDNDFVIQGNHPALIREYLSLGTQGAIRQLAQSDYFYDLYLRLGGGTLRVTKRSGLYKQEDLLRFVVAFEGLFISLVSARSLGIEFLPVSAPARIIDSHCQVCGENLQGSVVYCTSCETPHHLDCWQYFGSCSVYACGQKRYRSKT